MGAKITKVFNNITTKMNFHKVELRVLRGKIF